MSRIFIGGEGMMWHRIMFSIVVVAGVLLLTSCDRLSFHQPTPTPTQSATPTPEHIEKECISPLLCVYIVEVKAWVDTDANGAWDADELPFSGVSFRGTGAGKDEEAISDESGVAGFTFKSAFTRSCDAPSDGCYAEWEKLKDRLIVEPDIPSGYRLTTPKGIQLEGEAIGFGFAPLSPTMTPAPSASPPTPTAPAPLCQSDSMPSEGSWFWCQREYKDHFTSVLYSTDGNACARLDTPLLATKWGDSFSLAGRLLALLIGAPESGEAEQIWIIDLVQMQVMKEIDLLSEKTRAMIDTYKARSEDSEVFYVHPIRQVIQSENLMMWSPDGRFLAYLAASQGDSIDVYVYDTAKNTTSQLTSGPTQALLIAWSPDSEWIVHQGAVHFTEYGKKIDDVWAVSAVTGQITRLFSPEDGNVQRIFGWISENLFLSGGGYFETKPKTLYQVSIKPPSVQAAFAAPFETAAYDPQSGTLLVDTSWQLTDLPDEGIYLQPALPADPIMLFKGQYDFLHYHPELGLFSADNPKDELLLFTPSGEILFTFPNSTWLKPSPDGMKFVVGSRFGQARLLTITGDELARLEACETPVWTQDSSALFTFCDGVFYQYASANGWQPRPVLRIKGDFKCQYVEIKEP